ncbi:uncharacterized protein F4822DRAFT_436419 [Hypoxylon trugodes]|uniref:uncharacterized protein n=1 Tax=Hypoxylon trugodes TaxID=326681 RepID=UPI0021934DED|nr:uncharacterized protein F4822DRAFT_436419 [Hypoxylon trugodes]KAI1390570.1 hypothetical protein F4822DRAFT_436419 [Hypoxylon trugodes]
MHTNATKSAQNVLLLFGPQIPRLVSGRLKDLRGTILGDLRLGFLIRIVRELPALWAATIRPGCPDFASLTRAENQLQELVAFFEGETEEMSGLTPPYNILLAPLTVITHIAEYVHFNYQGSAQGFCIGFLAAAAVACARNGPELEKWASTAIRLAVCIGATIDLDEQERSNGGDSNLSSCNSTWSIRWVSNAEKERFEKVLSFFPEAYVSCVTDVDRITLTIPDGDFANFSKKLAEGGLSVQPVGIFGQYHRTTPDRETTVEQLKSLCHHNKDFQFLISEQLTLPLRSTSNTEIITQGLIHDIALESTLLDLCRWHGTVQAELNTWDDRPVNVIAVGNTPGTIPQSLRGLVVEADECLAVNDQAPSLLNATPPYTGMNSNWTTGQVTPHSTIPPGVVGTTQPVAVIGMACRYAQSDSLEQFWSFINSGKNATTPVPGNRFKSEELWRTPKGPFWGNFLQDVDAFDHRFFGMSAREAASMDPQQRVLLQVAYEAMESAGYADGVELPNRPVGCYVGAGYVEYEDNVASDNATAFSATGTIRAFISGKISHYFGWTGPSVVFDTACSSSAVAIHHACKALQVNDCSVAIAGGVNVITSPIFYQNLAAASFLSTTGASKAFDAQANGYCRGEGAGILVLKPLAQAIADNDRILGTIVGSAVNQNTSCSPITVPDSQSQSELYLRALAGGGISPSEVSYVEAHGTGTPVGDPIECASIRNAFGDPHRTQELIIGSVKDVIGHTEAASGAAGVIKALLMMQHGIIPKQPNFTQLNPKIPALEPDKLAIASQVRSWHTTTRRTALINNYGAAGSNAAIVVREYRPGLAAQDAIDTVSHNNPIEYPIFLSAKTAESLRAYGTALKSFLDRNPSIALGDVAYNLACKQNRSFEYTSSWTTTNLPSLRQELEAIVSGARPLLQRSTKKKTDTSPWPTPVVLCFSGQAGRSICVSRELVQSSTLLRTHLESCDEAGRALGLPSFFPRIFDLTPVEDLALLHVMLFSLQYASARAWIDAGLRVSTLVGHSFGQLTALCVAGSLDLADGIRLIAGRAQLMQEHWGVDPGVMLAVEGDKDNLESLLKTVHEIGAVDIACFNGPRNIVLAGEVVAMDAVERICRESPNLKIIRLANSHAYHSRLADSILDNLRDLAGTITWRKPSIPVETCSPGQSWTGIDANRIAEHTRQPVYFGEAVQRIAARNQSCVWLEAGSASPIISMVRRALPATRGSDNDVLLPIELGRNNPWSSLAKASSSLWSAGSNADFWAFNGSEGDRYRWLDLPPYQFAKTRHWIQYQPHRPQAAIETPVPSAGPPELLQQLGDGDGEYLFAVDPSHEVFELSVKGHAVVGQTLCPAGLYFELAIRAAQSLQNAKEKGRHKAPWIENMRIISPLGLKPNGTLRVSLKQGASQDGNVSKWSFSFFSFSDICSRALPPSQRTVHAQGVVTLLEVDAANSRLKFVQRLLGRSRYDQIASSPSASRLAGDVLYKIFSRVVNYAPYYKGVRNTIAWDGEVVGDVVMPLGKEAELLGTTVSNPLAIDNFLQVAGIHVNCLLDKSNDDNVSVCNAIGEVIWGDGFLQADSDNRVGAAGPLTTRTWRIYSNLEPKGKNTLVNDVFVLDAKTNEVVVALLDAEFTEVPLVSLRRVLSKLNQNTITTVSSETPHLPTALVRNFATEESPAVESSHNERARFDEQNGTDPLPTSQPKLPTLIATSGVDDSVRKMLSEIFGMSADEVRPDSDLAELGMDSLMITEISGEIRKRFSVNLSIDDLQNLTDVQSLAQLLGGGVQAPAPEPMPTSTEERTTQDRLAGLEGIPNGILNGGGETIEEREVDGGVAVLGSDWLSINRNTFDKEVENSGFGRFREIVYPLQAQLVTAYVIEAFAALGSNIRVLAAGEILPKLNYLPKHEKLVVQMFKILEDARLIAGSGLATKRTDHPAPKASAQALHDAIVQKFPHHAGEHQLLRTTGAQLAECLTGRADPLALMFGDSKARQLMEDVYTNGPMFRAATSFLAHFLVDVCGRFQGKREIRILELGAGTGGTTKHLIQKLEKGATGQRIVYTFSDVSKSLVAAAKRKFTSYPFVEYAVVDIEKDPTSDLRGKYDIIISTNCIHATASLVRSCTNIRHMLREDGMVCLVEHTQNLYWFDLVWGLVEGWWAFDDGRTHALASEMRWKKDLLASGFQWVDWSDGISDEAKILRVIVASPSPQKSTPTVNNSEQEMGRALEVEETVVFKHAGPLPLYADIYYPSNLQTCNQARAVALMIHGGGHVMLSRKDIRPKQTQILLDAGFVPVSVDYRLCPETNLLEGPITDVKDALSWARNTLPSLSRKRPDVHIDGSRVVAVGWSTGGTLALSLGWTAPSAGLQPPQAILAFYCPTDYEDECWSRVNKPYGDAALAIETYDLWEGVFDSPITSYNPPAGAKAAGGWMAKDDARSRIILHMNWYGQTVPVLVHGLKKDNQNGVQYGMPSLPTPTPAQVQAISPLAQIKRGAYRTPTFLIHPFEDDLIPWRQTQRTAEELRHRGVEGDLRLVGNAPHLFDIYRGYEMNLEAFKAIKEGYNFLSRYTNSI